MPSGLARFSGICPAVERSCSIARQLGVWLTSGCRQCTTARDADGATRCNLRQKNRLLVPGRKRRELLLGELGYKVAVLRLQLVQSDDRTLLAEAEKAAVLDGHTLDLAVRVFEDRVTSAIFLPLAS